jgi:hypothetical protein
MGEGEKEAGKEKKYVCHCGKSFPTKSSRWNHRRKCEVWNVRGGYIKIIIILIPSFSNLVNFVALMIGQCTAEKQQCVHGLSRVIILGKANNQLMGLVWSYHL